jgi:hypothetical protein
MTATVFGVCDETARGGACGMRAEYFLSKTRALAQGTDAPTYFMKYLIAPGIRCLPQR